MKKQHNCHVGQALDARISRDINVIHSILTTAYEDEIGGNLAPNYLGTAFYRH